MITRSVLLASLLLGGCASHQLNELHTINLAPYDGNCKGHVASKIELVKDRYPYKVMRTCNQWLMAGCHVSLVVSLPDGDYVLDNGALRLGTEPIPFDRAVEQVSGRYWLRDQL